LDSHLEPILDSSSRVRLLDSFLDTDLDSSSILTPGSDFWMRFWIPSWTQPPGFDRWTPNWRRTASRVRAAIASKGLTAKAFTPVGRNLETHGFDFGGTLAPLERSSGPCGRNGKLLGMHEFKTPDPSVWRGRAGEYGPHGSSRAEIRRACEALWPAQPRCCILDPTSSITHLPAQLQTIGKV